jgi:hypothetical protein
MGFFSLVGKGLRALFTPASFKTGERFENYIRKKLFTDRYYEQLQRTYGYNVKTKNFVHSSNPDFKFRDRRKSKIFYAEAKYRKSFYKGQLTWCTDDQLEHYQRCNREFPVFIILGVGGEPWQPAFVALIPLHKVNFTSIYLSLAEKYQVRNRRPVLSKTLWRR